MSTAHAKSDDDFDDGFELDADAFDAIEALALTHKPPVPQQVAGATAQAAPTPLLAAAASDDNFSDDSFVVDDATLDAFDEIDAAFEAAQQQRQQQQQQQALQPAVRATAPADSSAPAPPLPRSSSPVASSSAPAQPSTSEPVGKSSLKRKRSPTADSAPSRKRTRTSSSDPLADAREITIRKLIDELQCVVCLQHVVHPHNLPSCGHCACAPCINGWFLARVKAGKTITCPVCRDSLPRSTQPMPAYMMRDCATTLVPHLSAEESKAWYERTAEWKPGEWTWKAEPVVQQQQQVVYEIDDSDGGGSDEDYSGEDDYDDDDAADGLSDDDDIQVAEVPAARHGTVIRLTALVDLT